MTDETGNRLGMHLKRDGKYAGINRFRGRIFLLITAVLWWSGADMDASAAGARFIPSAKSVACYDFLEVAIQVPSNSVANPFTEAVAEGEFGLKGQGRRAVEGFCDAQDGSVYRIRFMPAKPGTYEYAVTFRQGEAAERFEGTFAAVAERRKGVLRVDPEFPWHFQWEGTQERFFWNSTTAYWLLGWDDEHLRGTVERLDQLKVNRIRLALNGRVKDGQAWFEPVRPSQAFSFLLNPWVARNPGSLGEPGFDVRRFNVAHWQKVERALRLAREKNMVLSLIFYVDGRRSGVDPFGKERMGGEDEQRYYRYAIARLAAFSNVMWDLANEYRLFRDDAWVEKMGALVKRHDPYGHLVSTHGHGDFRFRKSPWADFAMYQSWDEHGGYAYMLRNRLEQEKTGRIMPQVNEEYGYEDHYPQGWGSDRKSPARSAENRRLLAWEIAMAGCYQTTGERANAGGGSGEASPGGWINGGGDGSMTMLEGYGHLHDFFTSIPFWKLRPDTNLVVSVKAASAEKSGVRVMAMTSHEKDLGVVYLPSGGVVTLRANVLQDGLRPLWFSPRDGGVRNARALVPKVYRAPDARDWVLLFRTPCNCSFREFDEEFEGGGGRR